jgi:hypothetical protein
MSFNKYLENLDKLTEKTYTLSSIFGIIKFFDDFSLPEKEVIKKLIASKNPYMTEEDIDLIVEDSETLIKKEEEKLEDGDEEEDLDEEDLDEDEIELEGEEETEEDREKRRQERRDAREKRKQERKEAREKRKEERKKEIKERIEKFKEIYKERLAEFKKQVKDLKKEAKDAAISLFNKVKEAGEALILAIVNLATSLPASILMIAAPPWNIAAAISLILLIIKSYFDLVAIVKQVLPFLQPTRLLTLLFDPQNLSKLGAILDIPVKLMLGIFGPVDIIQKGINKLIEFIKNLLGEANKKKIFIKATRRLIKLGHIRKKRNGERGEEYLTIDETPITLTKYDEDGTEISVPITVYAYDEDDVPEILGLLDQFEIKDGDKWGGKSYVYDFRDEKIKNADGLIKSIEDGLEKNKIKVDPNATTEYDQFLYNITLPDGTTITNISEEGLKYFKEKYELKFNFDIE